MSAVSLIALPARLKALDLLPATRDSEIAGTMLVASAIVRTLGKYASGSAIPLNCPNRAVAVSAVKPAAPQAAPEPSPNRSL